MMRAPALFPATLVAAALLAGCAADTTVYPSLLPRAAEKQGFDEPAVRPPAPVVADPALDRRIADTSAKLDRIVRGFDADAARADRAAGAAGVRTVGSDAWIAAQTALAGLDDWRAQTSEVGTEIDDLVRTRVETVGTPYPGLEALRARLTAAGTQQTARIAALGARVPSP